MAHLWVSIRQRNKRPQAFEDSRPRSCASIQQLHMQLQRTRDEPPCCDNEEQLIRPQNELISIAPIASSRVILERRRERIIEYHFRETLVLCRYIVDPRGMANTPPMGEVFKPEGLIVDMEAGFGQDGHIEGQRIVITVLKGGVWLALQLHLCR